MFEKYEQGLNRKIEDAINKSLDILKKSIDDKTPEDTKTLLGNNEIEKAKTFGNTISGKVLNDKTPYGIFVEYGVMGKKYNYNKPKGNIFYKGIGARMFTRGYDETKQEILNNLKNVGTQ